MQFFCRIGATSEAKLGFEAAAGSFADWPARDVTDAPVAIKTKAAMKGRHLLETRNRLEAL